MASDIKKVLEQATARPWRAESQPDVAPAKVFGPKHEDGGDYAALFTTYDHANAHLVAAAVNAFESNRELIRELSESLQEMLTHVQFIRMRRNQKTGPNDCTHRAVNALAKAREAGVL